MAPAGESRLRGPPTRPVAPASGADGREPRLVGEPRGGKRAQSRPGRRVAVELGEPAEQDELVGRRAAPAAIEVQLGEREVEVRVGRARCASAR